MQISQKRRPYTGAGQTRVPSAEAAAVVLPAPSLTQRTGRDGMAQEETVVYIRMYLRSDKAGDRTGRCASKEGKGNNVHCVKPCES